MTHIAAASCPTADGVFTVLTDETHVLASGWTQDAGELMELIHPSLRAPLQQNPAPPPQVLAEALRAVAAYYEGDPAAPGTVPVHQRSGPFRQQAWEVLRGVQPGAPLTYSQYAAAAGRPEAVRAAAGACAKNAAALFVPCHRVVRTDGSLGGFRYGTRLKRSLLSREAESGRLSPGAR